MTVAALTQTRAQISGDGVTDRIDVTFQFVDETDLKVIHTDSAGVDTEWVYGQSPGDWNFTGGDYAAGTVHFTASDLAIGERLTVVLTSQYDQALSLDGGEIDPTVLERGMDRSALHIQAIAGDVSRSLRVAASAEGDPIDLEVPELPEGYGFVREGDALVPALIDSSLIAASVVSAQEAQGAAETAQAAAESAQSEAEDAETNAETSETNAANSAVSASNSATAASGSASSAASSATAAANSASSAASSKTAAETAETNAEAAESNAATLAGVASAAATAAGSSESSAASSASFASGSASSASSSATAAANSATAAASSETAATSAQTAAEAARAAAEAAAAGDAADISFTASGNLSSDSVQDALEELDTEKASVTAVAANTAKIASVAILHYGLAAPNGGGLNVAGAWTLYPLNTETFDPGGIVTLSSSEFVCTVAALCEFFGAFYATQGTLIRLHNVTDGVEVARSPTIYLHASNADVAYVRGLGLVEAGKTYRIEYYTQRAQNSYGLGLDSRDGGNSVFGGVFLRAI